MFKKLRILQKVKIQMINDMKKCEHDGRKIGVSKEWLLTGNGNFDRMQRRAQGIENYNLVKKGRSGHKLCLNIRSQLISLID